MYQNFFIGNNSLTNLLSFINSKNYSKIFVLTDTNTCKYCLPVFSKVISKDKLKIITIKCGEKNKSLKTAETVWKILVSENADRNSLLINLGGGMVCDLGGFVASVYKRGIKYINVPTSLIGMVDAAFGGKTAINIDNYKNQVGSFYLPEFVYVNPAFLKTLTIDELKSGFAEMIKYALIYDYELWQEIFQTNDLSVVLENEEILKKCIEIKLEIVKQDPYEKGIRKVLNAGHTIGHALESLSLKMGSPITHGHAVALGLVYECYLSEHELTLPKQQKQEIEFFILQHFDNIPIFEKDIRLLIEFMKADKKNSNEKINFSLLEKIGKAKVDCMVDNNKLLALLINTKL